MSAHKEYPISLPDLSPEGRDLLYSAGKEEEGRALSKGQILLKEGQICRSIYFIEAGLVRSVQNKDGKDINLHFSPEGSFVTHLKSLRTETPADYALQALEPTRIREFGKKELQDLYTRSPEIASFGRALLEKLLLEQEEHSHLFKSKSPTERYHYLAEHAPGLLQRISLTQLSSYLGISRETVSRIRKK
jgi:CRP-like cAMP-binding protein